MALDWSRPLPPTYVLWTKNKFSIFIYLPFLYVCMFCLHVYLCTMCMPGVCRRQIFWSWSYRWLWDAMWMLGINFWSPVREASALDLWAMSLTQASLKLLCFCFLCVSTSNLWLFRNGQLSFHISMNLPNFLLLLISVCPSVWLSGVNKLS